MCFDSVDVSVYVSIVVWLYGGKVEWWYDVVGYPTRSTLRQVGGYVPNIPIFTLFQNVRICRGSVLKKYEPVASPGGAINERDFKHKVPISCYTQTAG